MALIYRASGDVENVEPKNGTDFQLEELQAIVDGWIEIKFLRDDEGRVMVLNEEGKLRNLPYNERATMLYRKFLYVHDFIVGDVLICDKSQIK
jgi:hypothetical protein